MAKKKKSTIVTPDPVGEKPKFQDLESDVSEVRQLGPRFRRSIHDTQLQISRSLGSAQAAQDTKNKSLTLEMKSRATRSDWKVRNLTQALLNARRALSRMNLLEAALSGNIELRVVGPAQEDISAARLNAAAAGTLKLPFTIAMTNSDGDVLPWANFEITAIVGLESVADTDVGIPVIEWVDDPAATPRFVNGVCDLIAKPDVDEGATKTYAVGTKSTGSVVCIAGSLLIDGEKVTITDVDGMVKIFELDSNGSITAGNVPVAFTAGDTAVQVADALRAAISGVGGFEVTASGATATVDVEQKKVGVAGDVAITETVVNVGFTVAGFTGGVDADSFAIDVPVVGDAVIVADVVKATKTFVAV